MRVECHIVGDMNGCSNVEEDCGVPSGLQPMGLHYQESLNAVEAQLRSNVEKFKDLLENTDDLDSEVVDLIQCAIGHTNLLLRKRFPSFRDLCHANIVKRKEMMVLDDDLIGLWDNLYLQIRNVEDLFSKISGKLELIFVD